MSREEFKFWFVFGVNAGSVDVASIDGDVLQDVTSEQADMAIAAHNAVVLDLEERWNEAMRQRQDDLEDTMTLSQVEAAVGRAYQEGRENGLHTKRLTKRGKVSMVCVALIAVGLLIWQFSL